MFNTCGKKLVWYGWRWQFSMGERGWPQQFSTKTLPYYLVESTFDKMFSSCIGDKKSKNSTRMSYIFPGKDKKSVSHSNMLKKIKGFVVHSSFKFNRDTINHVPPAKLFCCCVDATHFRYSSLLWERNYKILGPGHWIFARRDTQEIMNG